MSREEIRSSARMDRRRIIVSIAISVDGYIARADGSVDWLDRPRPKGNYGMNEFFASIDTVLWGRKTYELGLRMGPSLGFGAGVRHYVFTRDPPKSGPPRVEFVREPVSAFARRLRSQPGKDVWIMGGAGLIASFLDAGEIDELRIAVVPVLIGEGIPLVEPRRLTVPLKLVATERFPDGVVTLRYEVGKRREGQSVARRRRAPTRTKQARPTRARASRKRASRA